MTVPVFAGAVGGGVGGLLAVTEYTGTGASQSVVTGQNLAVGGLAWFKQIDGVGSHYIIDTARGIGRYILSDSSAAQVNTGLVTSFNRNGVTIPSSPQISDSGDNFVLYSWLVSEGYFDIVTYTGDGVNGRALPHSLGVAPSMLFVKDLTNFAPWAVYHKQLNGGSNPAAYYLALDSTAAEDFSGGYWNYTSPDSSIITLGTGGFVNSSGRDYVCYAFAEKTGFSKAGSYTGNGAPNSITGVGFTPSLLLVRNVSSGGNWNLFFGEPEAERVVLANTTQAESAADSYITFTSDGFDLTGAGPNVTGEDYIYMAWK